MKKILSLIIFTLLLLGCGGNGGTGTSPQSILTGTWLYTYPNQCIEIHKFTANGTWDETALDEISNGTYTLKENTGGGKHTLSVNVISDNGLADC